MDDQASDLEVFGFESRANHGLASMRVFLSLVLLLLSVLLLLNGWTGDVPPALDSLPHEFWAVLGILSFGFSSYYSLRFLIDPRPRLEIGSQGIVNRTLWSSPVVVPWDEVVGIRDTAWPGFREIILRDRSDWVARQPWSVRAWSRYSRLLGFGAVPVNLWVLEATWDRVDDSLRAAADLVELEALRAAAALPESSAREE